MSSSESLGHNSIVDQGDRNENVNARSLRWLHSAIALVFLSATLIGFMPFFTKGEGMGGRQIPPDFFALVLAHGMLLTTWIMLFFSQAVLISSRNHRLHMKFGWSSIAFALAIVITGFMVTIRSVGPVPNAPFRGMAYHQFMLLMFVELIAFAVFVALGVALRKQAAAHKAMMILAVLSVLPASTIRLPFLIPIFGDAGWSGFYGAVFALGAIILIARSIIAGSFDRWFAAGYAAMVVVFVAATKIAVTDFWSHTAMAILSK